MSATMPPPVAWAWSEVTRELLELVYPRSKPWTNLTQQGKTPSLEGRPKEAKQVPGCLGAQQVIRLFIVKVSPWIHWANWKNEAHEWGVRKRLACNWFATWGHDGRSSYGRVSKFILSASGYRAYGRTSRPWLALRGPLKAIEVDVRSFSPFCPFQNTWFTDKTHEDHFIKAGYVFA